MLTTWTGRGLGHKRIVMGCWDMITIQRWSGLEARALREARRMTVRAFAAFLGISERTVSNWDAGGVGYVPGPESQRLLDTALAQADVEVRTRFEVAVTAARESGLRQRPPAPTETVDQPATTPTVMSHKFIPAFIGTTAVRRIITDARFVPVKVANWLPSWSCGLSHPDGSCMLYVFDCGVGVAHVEQRCAPDRLADLATWRYRTYPADLEWLTRQLSTVIGTGSEPAAPEYVLSLYCLDDAPCLPAHLDAAVRLACVPSVLVDRTRPDAPHPLGRDVEEALLASGFDHADIVPFGVPGVSIGYAGWSGVAYHALAADRALSATELVECEVVVQMLWCYSQRILANIEEGRDPSVPEEFGWRFLRAALTRLTTARPQETSQHCLMREAVVATSRVDQRLRTAIDALRDDGELRPRWTDSSSRRRSGNAGPDRRSRSTEVTS
jgi:transcriptional regulator with XRE-family HTH domain